MSAPQTFPNAQAVVPNWYDDRRARVLLASIAGHHPTCEVRFDTYVTTRDEWAVYVGYRVECLERIYGEYWRRYATEPSKVDDWATFDAFNAQPRVQDVVADAVNPPRCEPEPSIFDTLLADVMLAQRPYTLGARA